MSVQSTELSKAEKRVKERAKKKTRVKRVNSPDDTAVKSPDEKKPVKSPDDRALLYTRARAPAFVQIEP